MSRRLKLMYLAGTQDPEAAFRYLRNGENDPAALFVPYVRQFLHLCDDTGAEGIVISARRLRRRLRLDRFTFYNVPSPLRSAHGRRYELGQILYGLLVATLCLVHRPHVVFVGDGMMHYRTIPLLRMSGARIVLSFHNTLWMCYSEEPDRWKGIALANRQVFRRSVSAIMCASDTIGENFRMITDGGCKPVIEFLPTFIDGALSKASKAPTSGDFIVLYAGRIMPSKGIFDMLRVAEILRERGVAELRVVMCGEGPADRALIDAIDARGLHEVVSYKGQLTAAAMVEQYAAANVVVVPTRTTFREGFNQVIAEAALAGRPVVTSIVCPATHYFNTGIQLAEPDSPESYADRVWSEYLHQRDGTYRPPVGEQMRPFNDLASGWRSAAMQALRLSAQESRRIPLTLFDKCEGGGCETVAAEPPPSIDHSSSKLRM